MSDGGTIQARYLLDISNVRQSVTDLRALFRGLKQDAEKLGGARTAPPTAEEVKYAQALARTAEAESRRSAATARKIEFDGRAARAVAQAGLAEQKEQTELAKTAKAQDQAAVAALRRAQAEERAARQSGLGTRGGLPILPRTVEAFGTQAIDQFKSGILGIVGPAAVATAAFTTLRASVDSLKQAFSFKAELDATNLGIRTNLEGVRDSGRVFEEAARFADKYRITQQETGEILKSSTDILRTSKSSVSDLEGALIRLQSRDVSKPISEAARALRELNSGDVTSIKELFNVPAAEALRMKNEIAAGGDAVQVLNGFLDRAGVSMAVLENRSKGAAGALNEQKIAQEQLTLAQARIAESAGGIFFVEALTRQYQGLANLLNGDALAGLQATGREFQVSAAGAGAYALALAQGKSAVEAQAAADLAATAAANNFAGAQRNGGGGTFEFADAVKASTTALTLDQIKKIDSQMATQALSEKQAQLEADSRRAAVGMLGAGDQALILAQKYGIAAGQAQFLINQQQALSNAEALADQRKGEQTGTDLTAKQFDAFSKLRRAREQEDAAAAKTAKDKATQEANRLRDAQDALNLARATTKEQKIAELTRQQRASTDPVEKLRLQAQIEQERRAGAGRVGTAQSTALQLQNTEENNQLALARIQREGLERLRDQEQDFDLKRSRSKEDEDRKIQGLLARGERAAAAREREDFTRQQRRDQEDFNIQRRRTLRNNAEQAGDTNARTDLRQEQIGNRAALRGVKTAGAAIPSDITPIPAGASAPPAPSRAQTIAQLTIQGVINLDGAAVATGIWPTLEVKIDNELAISLAQAGIPGAGQQAVGGSG